MVMFTRFKKTKFPVPSDVVRSRSTVLGPNTSGAGHVKIPFPIDHSSNEANSVQAFPFPLEHTYQETKVHTTVSRREFLPSRNKIYDDWRHTDSFGLTAGAAGKKKKKPHAFGTPREVSKLRLDLYQGWQYTDSFGRMGVHAKKDEGLGLTNDSAGRLSGEAGKLTTGAAGDLADGETASVKVVGEKDSSEVKDVLGGGDEGMPSIKEDEQAGNDEDAVWGRGSYPYTRIF